MKNEINQEPKIEEIKPEPAEPIETIEINAELQALIPPLAPDELQALEESIKTEGCRDPLVLWGNILIDGHNRYKICKKHNIKYNTVKMEFPDLAAVKVWMIGIQTSRRNLNDYSRTLVALKLKPILQAQAKANMSAGGGDKKTGQQNSANPMIITMSTSGSLAKAAKVSTDTVVKVAKLDKHASAALKAALLNNKISINLGHALMLENLPESQQKAIINNKNPKQAFQKHLNKKKPTKKAPEYLTFKSDEKKLVFKPINGGFFVSAESIEGIKAALKTAGWQI